MSSAKNFDSWQDGVLYTTVSVKIIRNIFTTIFFVLGFAIHMLGSHYLKKRNVNRLNRSRDAERVIPLTWMASWLPLPSVLQYYWKTRMLPGGNYGFVMIFAGTFSAAHPYFVNNLIQITSISTPTICSFQKGVITTLGIGGLPSSTFACASTVYNAQLSVYRNGAAQGIWKLVNYTSDNFYPYPEDVLGYWDCTAQQNTTIDLTQYTYVTDSSDLLYNVEAFLAEQNFLYNETNVTPRVFYGGVSTGFLAWSANETNVSNNTWTVLGLAQLPMLLNNGNWTPPVMPSNDTLTEWAPATFGYLMNDAPENFYFDLELKLNAMTMISGTGNNDLRPLSRLPDGESAFYGCLLNGTALDPAIWGVLGAIFSVLLAISFGAAFMTISHALRAKNSQNGVTLIHDTPAGIDDWQVALLKEYINEDITMAQAKEYSFGWDSNKQAFVFARNGFFKNGAVDYPPTELQSLRQNIAYSASHTDTSKAQSIV